MTNSSGGFSGIGIKHVLDLIDILVREDHSNVESELVGNDLKVRSFLPFLISLFVICVTFFWLRLQFFDSSLHQSVFAHEHFGIQIPELLPHDADLLAGYVIDFDE